MNPNVRFSLVLLLQLVLLWFLGESNSVLGRFALALHLDGLLLISPATLLPPGLGGLLVGILALAWDSVYVSVPMGTSLVLWLLAYAILRRILTRVRPESRLHLVILAMIANLVILSLKALFLAGEGLGMFSYWRSWALETSLSTLLIFLGTGWFLALQDHVLRIFGTRPAREPTALS